MPNKINSDSLYQLLIHNSNFLIFLKLSGLIWIVTQTMTTHHIYKDVWSLYSSPPTFFPPPHWSVANPVLICIYRILHSRFVPLLPLNVLKLFHCVHKCFVSCKWKLAESAWLNKTQSFGQVFFLGVLCASYYIRSHPLFICFQWCYSHLLGIASDNPNSPW